MNKYTVTFCFIISISMLPGLKGMNVKEMKGNEKIQYPVVKVNGLNDICLYAAKNIQQMSRIGSNENINVNLTVNIRTPKDKIIKISNSEDQKMTISDFDVD